MPNIHCLHVLGGAVTVQPALLDDSRKVVYVRYVIDRRHGRILTLAKDSGTLLLPANCPKLSPFALHSPHMIGGRAPRQSRDGWPSLCEFFFLPFRDCGCPILAFFARACPEPAEGVGTMPSTPRAVRPGALDRTDHAPYMPLPFSTTLRTNIFIPCDVQPCLSLKISAL
jgi:hypothetical protein